MLIHAFKCDFEGLCGSNYRIYNSSIVGRDGHTCATGPFVSSTKHFKYFLFVCFASGLHVIILTLYVLQLGMCAFSLHTYSRHFSTKAGKVCGPSAGIGVNRVVSTYNVWLFILNSGILHVIHCNVYFYWSTWGPSMQTSFALELGTFTSINARCPSLSNQINEHYK